MRSEPQKGTVFVDREEQKAAVAKAAQWVLRQAARLRVTPEAIEHAIRSAILPDDIERRGSNLAFLAMIAGRSPSITKLGKYAGDDRNVFPAYSLAFAQQQLGRERRNLKQKQRRAA